MHIKDTIFWSLVFLAWPITPFLFTRDSFLDFLGIRMFISLHPETVLSFMAILGISAMLFSNSFKRSVLKKYKIIVKKFSLFEKNLLTFLNNAVFEKLTEKISEHNWYITSTNFKILNNKYFKKRLKEDYFNIDGKNKKNPTINKNKVKKTDKEIIDEWDESIEKKYETKTDKEIIREFYEHENFYDLSLFLLSIAVACSDGRVKEENDLLSEKFKLTNDENELLKILFARVSGSGAADSGKAGEGKLERIVLKLLKHSTKGDPKKLDMIFNNLLAMAEVDGKISQKEKDCLRTMAKSLGFNINKLNDIIDKKVKVLENKKESYPPIIDDVYDEIVEDILD